MERVGPYDVVIGRRHMVLHTNSCLLALSANDPSGLLDDGAVFAPVVEAFPCAVHYHHAGGRIPIQRRPGLPGPVNRTIGPFPTNPQDRSKWFGDALGRS